MHSEDSNGKIRDIYEYIFARINLSKLKKINTTFYFTILMLEFGRCAILVTLAMAICCSSTFPFFGGLSCFDLILISFRRCRRRSARVRSFLPISISPLGGQISSGARRLAVETTVGPGSSNFDAASFLADVEAGMY